uniref:VPS13_mid_rpt domain-containing protein n=1 Tax=Schistocephalus solidus TaxID=70667 RepID=A0A183SBK4_SCHSO
LQDITVGCVMLDQQQQQRTSTNYVDMPFFSKLGKIVKPVLDPEQESLISNAFIASDLRMHKLPSSTDLISVDWTHYFTFDSPAEGRGISLSADISNLLAEKNGLHKAYMDLRIDATKAALFSSHRLVQQRLREMQDD